MTSSSDVTPQMAMPKLPDAPTNAPVFGQNPAGQKPKRKSAFATYLGPNAAPSAANAGTKTLIGT